MNKNRQNKALAAVLATSILVTGTFAWQSFSQLATNETLTEGGLAGGRLHDYFFHGDEDSTGYDRVQQIFVENFAGVVDLDEDNDNEPVNPNNYTSNIYARVRISEYLEYGHNAGYITDDNMTTEYDAKTATPVRGDYQISSLEDLDINEPSTWDVYLFGSEKNGNNIRTYRELEFGDSVAKDKTYYYLPTFNQDHDDKSEDYNGTLAGNNDNRHDDDAYGDYVEYGEGDVVEDYIKYRDPATGNQATSSKEYEHEVQGITTTEEVMSMETWLALPSEDKVGPYWVFDTDGWAYWAQAITPNSTTGLLLSGINEVETVEGTTTYYAVHAEAQIATAGDWGTEKVEATEDTDEIPATGMYADSFSISGQMVLNYAAKLDGTLATYTGLDEATILGYKGTENTITIENVEFYVLDLDTIETYETSQGGDATEIMGVFLYAKDPWQNKSISFSVDNRDDGYDGTYWAGSNLQSVMEEDLKNTSVLLSLAEYVDTTVEPYVTEQDTVNTYDRFYPLSLEEFTYYELSGTAIAKDSSGAIGSTTSGERRWLRTPNTSATVRTIDATTGTLATVNHNYKRAVRPALWVEL